MTSRQSPTVIGLYGISGSGKTYLQRLLKASTDLDGLSFFEGSEVLDAIVPGGLANFHSLEGPAKCQWREAAIRWITDKCKISSTAAIVTGHCMFWDETTRSAQPVVTEADLATYTHIIYHHCPPEEVAARRRADLDRTRPSLSTDILQQWQDAELRYLRSACYQHQILLTFTPPMAEGFLARLTAILRRCMRHGEATNQERVCAVVDSMLSSIPDNPSTAVMIDGDKTFVAEDAGGMWWEGLSADTLSRYGAQPLTAVFEGTPAYTHHAFYQAMLMYEDVAQYVDIQSTSMSVAQRVGVRRELLQLLEAVQSQQHIVIFLISCGLDHIWQSILERLQLTEQVHVVAMTLGDEGYVITPKLKGEVVRHLRTAHRMRVWAFGDSPIDIPMLEAADQAMVVVGDPSTRSRSMDNALRRAQQSGLRAVQVLMPADVTSRLTEAELPVVSLSDPRLMECLITPGALLATFSHIDATHTPASRLLATSMRDATRSGPDLRQVYQDAGWYLAMQYLSRELGMEKQLIAHVQGGRTDGYRIHDGSRTLIVAMMRSGEPLATGVNLMLRRAAMVHAREPGDVGRDDLRPHGTVILVDSVINTGRSMIAFIRHLQMLKPTVRICAVTGVVQSECLTESHELLRTLQQARVTLLSLRTSTNSYVGVGQTDTGNRLFNTEYGI